MTIIEAINRVDTIKPNAYTQQDKVQWLSVLDGIVKKEIIDTHEGAEEVSFKGYNYQTPIGTELLIPAPYDEVYVHYLEMNIDYANGEYGKYNNSNEMYQTSYLAFERYYNRTHMPIGKKIKFF